MEEEFSKVVDSVIDSQEEEVLKELDSDSAKALLGLGSDADFSAIAPLAVLTSASMPMASMMDDVYQQGVTDNIQEGYGSPVSEDTKNASVSQNVATVNEFNSTTQDQIVNALAQASLLGEDGDGDVDIVFKTMLAYALIKSIFNRLRSKRKPLIIDAGVLGAYNLGLFDSSVENEIQSGGTRTIKKEWVSLKDEKVRLAHRDLDGEKVPVQDAFIYNGIPIRFPKDPLAPPNLTINCRCALKFSR